MGICLLLIATIIVLLAHHRLVIDVLWDVQEVVRHHLSYPFHKAWRLTAMGISMLSIEITVEFKLFPSRRTATVSYFLQSDSDVPIIVMTNSIFKSAKYDFL